MVSGRSYKSHEAIVEVELLGLEVANQGMALATTKWRRAMTEARDLIVAQNTMERRKAALWLSAQRLHHLYWELFVGQLTALDGELFEGAVLARRKVDELTAKKVRELEVGVGAFVDEVRRVEFQKRWVGVRGVYLAMMSRQDLPRNVITHTAEFLGWPLNWNAPRTPFPGKHCLLRNFRSLAQLAQFGGGNVGREDPTLGAGECF